MKKIIITMMMFILLANIAFAISMSKDVPTTVNAGETFTVRFNIDTEGYDGLYVVTYLNDVSGGCEPQHFASGFTSPVAYRDHTFTAPSSGSCTFSGDFQFVTDEGTGAITNFPQQTVQIEGVCIPGTCSSLGLTCGTHNDGCGGLLDCGVCTTTPVTPTPVTPSPTPVTVQEVTQIINQIPMWIYGVIGILAFLLLKDKFKK